MIVRATNNSVLHSDSPNNPAIQRKEQRGTQLHREEASNFTTTCIEVCTWQHMQKHIVLEDMPRKRKFTQEITLTTSEIK